MESLIAASSNWLARTLTKIEVICMQPKIFFCWALAHVITQYVKSANIFLAECYRGCCIHFLIFFFSKIKNNSRLAYRVICCSPQSDRRVRVCLSHQSDCRVRVCISHQSDCLIKVSIFHQSYNSFEYLAPTTAFGYCFLVYDVMYQEAVHKEWH